MSDTIVLDLTKINQAGNDIKTKSTEIYKKLLEVEKIIKDSKNVYDSESGEKFRADFRKAASKFEEFKKEVDKYGDFLIKESQGRGKDDKDVFGDY